MSELSGRQQSWPGRLQGAGQSVRFNHPVFIHSCDAGWSEERPGEKAKQHTGGGGGGRSVVREVGSGPVCSARPVTSFQSSLKIVRGKFPKQSQPKT